MLPASDMVFVFLKKHNFQKIADTFRQIEECFASANPQEKFILLVGSLSGDRTAMNSQLVHFKSDLQRVSRYA